MKRCEQKMEGVVNLICHIDISYTDPNKWFENMGEIWRL
jgi:hypothetical protein